VGTNDWQGEVVASAARTTTGQSGTLSTHGARTLDVAVDVTAVSGTTPSLTLSVEWSTDGGTTWFVGDVADAFTAITAAAKRTRRFDVKGGHYRLVWTISGTTPSFTFAVDAHLEDIA
jgi:hypothetical protein